METLATYGTPAQVKRVAREINRLGYRTETHTDALGVPVAVRVPGVISAATAEPYIVAAMAHRDDLTKRFSYTGISDVLPYGTRSGEVYPKVICDLLDAVVRAAAGRDEVAATQLCAPEGGVSIGVGDAGPHTDFPADLTNPPAQNVHGVNVHLTLRGEGTARFSLVRDFAQVDVIANRLQAEIRAKRTVIEANGIFPELYAEFMEFASAPIRHKTGDVLIFQARPHREKGLLPTVHHFESVTEDRWNNVFLPQAAPRDETVDRRARVVNRLQLGPLGYQ